MIVTLRNKRTGEFLTTTGEWARSGNEAHNFSFTDAAEEAREKLAQPDIHIFYIRKATSDQPCLDCAA